MLEEQHATPSPDGFLPRGGAFVDDTTALIWGSGGYLLFSSSGSTRWVAFDSAVDPRGLRITSRTPLSIEVIDAHAMRIVRIDADGEIVHTLALPLTGRIRQAAVIDTTWLVHTVIDTVDYRLYVQSQADSGGWRVVYPADAHDHPFTADVASFRLSGSGGAAFLNELRTPFRAWQILKHDAIVSFKRLTGADRAIHGFAEMGIEAGDVIALPTVLLDAGLLHQLARLTGDSRIIVLSDDAEKVLRSTTWEVAIGMIASDPDTRRLIAFRDTGLREIVLYRWGWDPDRDVGRTSSGDRQ